MRLGGGVLVRSSVGTVRRDLSGRGVNYFRVLHYVWYHMSSALEQSRVELNAT